MDPFILQAMIFSIIVIVLLGGFTLLFPLTRQLGKVLEKKYLEDGTGGTNAQDRRAPPGGAGANGRRGAPERAAGLHREVA